MKLLPLILCFLTASSFLFGQDDAWSLFAYSYRDSPITTYTVDNVDPQGSSITPNQNVGQLFCFERRFDFDRKLDFMAGLSIGYHQLRIDLVNTNALQSNPDARDADGSIWRAGAEPFGIYFGTSYNKSITDKLNLQCDLRLGALTINPSSARHTSRIAFESLDYVRSEASFYYNSQKSIFAMILPSISLNYKFTKIPLGFHLGLAAMYSPSVYLGGHIILPADGRDYMVYLYDRFKTAGLKVGLSYEIQ